MFERTKELARDKVLASVRTLYFPELWYAIESHFQLALKIKSKRVLEVGYGVGLVGEAFAKLGWNVAFTDPSVTALTALKARLDSSGLAAGFEQAEAGRLPVASASYDYLVSINALELCSDPGAAVREVARVLAPGGRAVVATFNALSPWGLPAVARAFRPDAAEERPAHFLFKNDFLRLLKMHKLQIIDVKERAAYLPGSARKIKIPLAGAFVALVQKP